MQAEPSNKTEIGYLPPDWNTTDLGKLVVKIGSGITPKGGQRVYTSAGRPFLRSQNVGWGTLILDDIVFIDESTHHRFDSTEIQNDDVFLNITGASIGRSAVANNLVTGGNVNQHVCIIRTDPDRLLPKYLNYFLLSQKGQAQVDSFQAGGNRQGLNFGQIKAFKVALPPTKAEQTAIATALSDADALITALEKLIEKKRNIKQGAMQELLRPKDGWTLKPLGTEIYVQGGYAFRSIDFTNSGLPVLRISDITNATVSLDNCVCFQGNNIPKEFIVNKGDILIAMSGATTGKIGIYNHDVPAYVNQRVGRFVIKAGRIDSRYLSQVVRSKSFVTNVTKLIAQGAQPNISSGQIESIDIAVPPSLTEQNTIGCILNDLDLEIDLLEGKVQKLRLIKQGMMQELLTGRTRLI